MSGSVQLGERVAIRDTADGFAGEVITRCDKGKMGVRVRCDDGPIRFALRFGREARS